jgi:hypothetical protein
LSGPELQEIDFSGDGATKCINGCVQNVRSI